MNTYLEKLYEQLGENHSVVYLDSNHNILGWLTKEDTLKLYYTTLYPEEITEDTASEVYQYLKTADIVYSCSTKEELYKILKEFVKIYLHKQNKNDLIKFKENLGKYYELYTGTSSILVGVSSNDEDYYNVFLTQDLKVVYSSVVGLPKEIKEIPESPLKKLIKEGKLKEYTKQLVNEVNTTYNNVDYIFLSL